MKGKYTRGSLEMQNLRSCRRSQGRYLVQAVACIMAVAKIDIMIPIIYCKWVRNSLTAIKIKCSVNKDPMYRKKKY